MDIKQEEKGNKGRFFYEVDGQEKAFMTYNYDGKDKMIISHTEVDSSLKGQGVGYKLVEASVKFARENQIKILPLCSYVASVFKKKSDYSDVLFIMN